MLKIASWNVNSLKVRLPQVLQWLESSGTHVLALQEIKQVDADFPVSSFAELGYHCVHSGQKTYNGVAIISREPICDVIRDVAGFEDPQRRILAVTIGSLRLINLYVPNGSEVGAEKYQYKLNWLKKITEFIREEMNRYPQLAVVGDFNIAPDDIDVHDPIEWEGSVLVSPPERQALVKLLSFGLHDSFRELHPESKLFSWWDYRAAAFRRNRGLRIDHILLSDALQSRCLESQIDVEPRRAERPSDHAPVLVTLSE